MSVRHRIQYTPPLTPDDACRLVLAAYYRSCGDAVPPIDYPADGLSEWSSPVEFVATMLAFFDLSVHAQMHRAGVMDLPDAVDRAERWSSAPTYGSQHVSAVDPNLWAQMQAERGAGRSPAAMAQGCADFDLGGGTAHASRVGVGDESASQNSHAPSPAKPLSDRDTS